MATPALSCSTDALSGAPIADSDDEVDDQSSMWVQEEDRAPADPAADLEDQTSLDLPADFLSPLSPRADLVPPLPSFPSDSTRMGPRKEGPETRQFWKSGDFVGSFEGVSFATEGMDHARVHPKFLHSNATSHKWVLGAIAELVDNSVDEIRNGATFVKIDVQPNPRNGEPMLVIEDDGGGMDPDCMRRCMSLGYSAKTKISGTIGQYGNGFKTSTMRLGADVVVFSRNQKNKPSESIGMMSYTFLTSTGQNDVVVPIVDFQIEAFGIRKLIRSNVDDWMESMQAIQDWSPYSSQAELVSQFRSMPRRQGTKVIIYNLWEDDEGRLELDFDAHPQDIQIGATTRDEKVLKLASQFPSCRHYLTHRHSLRTYISILYLRLPGRFKIFLRGTEVRHHSLQKEMMLVERVTYRPKDLGNSKAVVTLGFVKDAEEHIDVSGFNVYHKNRLIKPFWRIWNSSDSRGRGIIAILEANFVEPAHDKQGFERTIILTRLEARLIEMQKSYWNKYCHKIGYTNKSLRKPLRPHSKDGTLPANGSVTKSLTSAKSQTSDVARATTCADTVQVGAKQAIQCAHSNNIATAVSDALGGVPAAIAQSMQTGSVNSSIREMGETSLIPISMSACFNGTTKSNEISSFRQEPAQVEPSLTYASQSVQDAPVNSLPKVVLNTTINVADLHSQESRVSSTVGVTPLIIDLDSPDVDTNGQDTDFRMSSPQNLYHEVEIISDKMHLKSTDAGSAYENLAWSDAAAPLPTKRETPESFDASMCSPLREDKPETIIFKSCSNEDSTGKHHGEAREEDCSIDNYVASNDLITAANEGCFAPAMALVEEWKEVVPESLERCIAAPNSSSEGHKQVELATLEKTVLENGCSAVQVSTTIELDELFDSVEEQSGKSLSNKDMDAFVQSPISQVEMILPDKEEKGALEVQLSRSADMERPSGHSPSIKDINAFVQSPVSQIQMILPDQEEKGALKVPLSRSADMQGANDVKIEDILTEQEDNDIIMCQVHCENVSKECVSSPLLPETAINALPDMDEVMVDVTGQENDERVGSEQNARNVYERMKYQQIGEQIVEPLDDTESHNQSKLFEEVQEHKHVGTSISPDQRNSLTGAVDEHESMAIILQNESNLHDGNNSQSSMQASCLDIVSIPTADMVDVVTDSVVKELSADLVKEERFMVVKQQLDYLQQSIDAIVVEVDDLKEQLQQERELQQIELTNLNMELERAILRVEELSG